MPPPNPVQSDDYNDLSQHMVWWRHKGENCGNKWFTHSFPMSDN